LLLAALFALPAGVVLIAEVSWPDADLLQRNRFYLGTDFVNYWTGGRLALTGRVEVVYDLARYNALLHEWFSPHQRLMNFSYPPHALLVFMGFGALPYLAALVLWSLAGLASFVWVALGRWPRREDATLVIAIVLAPVVWANIVIGQFGLLLATAFVGALRALPARPVLAGALIGALTVKPQLGLLLPLMLVALREWRALAAAAATAALLVALSVVLFGTAPWHAYVGVTMPFQWQFVEIMNGFYRFQMTTPYAVFWFLGLPVQVALWLQAAVSVAVAAAAWMVLRSGASWPLKGAVVALGSTLMVPYVLAYDLAIPYAALLWYLREGGVRSEPLGVALVGLLWALPFALGALAQTHGLPLLPVVLLAVYVWLVREALSADAIGLARPAGAPLGG
jgi:hypothetical protein